MLKIGKVKCGVLGCIVPVLDVQNINGVFEYKNIKLNRKREFHITLFTDKLTEKINYKCSEEQTYKLHKFLNEFDYNFKLTSKIHFLKKDYDDHIRFSKIVEVEMENQTKFESEFSSIVGFEYKIFPHMTTHSSANIKEKEGIGIAIQTKDDLKKYILN